MSVIIFDMDEEVVELPEEEIYEQQPRRDVPMIDLSLEIVPVSQEVPRKNPLP